MTELTYISASILLGLGIAIDVGLASLAAGHLLNDGKRRRFWIAAVTTTHVLFPMIGYYGFAAAYVYLPGFELVLGLLSVGLVGYFLISEFIELSSTAEDGDDTLVGLSWALVLAVSWDALWSGPAKSAQAINWSSLEIFFSFLIAGLVVAAVATVMTLVSSAFRARLGRMKDLKHAATTEVVALWVEFSVIGYFAFLAAARYIFASEVPALTLLFASHAGFGILFLIFRRRLIAAKLSEYEVC